MAEWYLRAEAREYIRAENENTFKKMLKKHPLRSYCRGRRFRKLDLDQWMELFADQGPDMDRNDVARIAGELEG